MVNLILKGQLDLPRRMLSGHMISKAFQSTAMLSSFKKALRFLYCLSFLGYVHTVLKCPFVCVFMRTLQQTYCKRKENQIGMRLFQSGGLGHHIYYFINKYSDAGKGCGLTHKSLALLC